MNRFQIISDLHLEARKAYGTYNIVPTAPNLALLGDIGVAVEHKDELQRFLKRQLRQFEVVLFVMGNHEAYGSSWEETIRVMRAFEQAQRFEDGQGDFILLDRDMYEISIDSDTKIAILGCSLFSHVPTEAIHEVACRLNDFSQTKPWTVMKHNEAHARDLTWLNAEVERLDQDSTVTKIVIFTHWTPTRDPRGADPRYPENHVTSAFSTDLSREKCSTSKKVTLWAFGHTHYNCNFYVDRKDAEPLRYYANQRGYYYTEADKYDEGWVVHL